MLNIAYWIPAFSTTFLFALALWLFRHLIATRLNYSVKNEFDKKIEFFRSELTSKQSQINSLRDGAMSGLIARQSRLYERQLYAVDQLWQALIELQNGKLVSSILSGFKFEASAKQSSSDPNTRDIFKIISDTLKTPDFTKINANSARPYVTPLAWAYYSAYSAIIGLAVSKLKILESGIKPPPYDVFDSDKIKKLLKTVLPSRSDLIDKHGSSIYDQLLDEIEDLLLLELKNILNGKESDTENTKRAREILESVEPVQAESTNTDLHV